MGRLESHVADGTARNGSQDGGGGSKPNGLTARNCQAPHPGPPRVGFLSYAHLLSIPAREQSCLTRADSQCSATRTTTAASSQALTESLARLSSVVLPCNLSACSRRQSPSAPPATRSRPSTPWLPSSSATVPFS